MKPFLFSSKGIASTPLMIFNKLRLHSSVARGSVRTPCMSRAHRNQKNVCTLLPQNLWWAKNGKTDLGDAWPFWVIFMENMFKKQVVKLREIILINLGLIKSCIMWGTKTYHFRYFWIFDPQETRIFHLNIPTYFKQYKKL